jgi:MoxR-like ATPase
VAQPTTSQTDEPTGDKAAADPDPAVAVSHTTPAEDATLVERALFEVKRVIVGQDRMVERMFVALLARGHCLLEGVPGVAKTLAVETLAKVVGGTFARVQFTPDLVPADLVGTRIYRQSSEKFDVELGPIFVNFLLTDEINRAPAKVQSALLEVMAEQHVSIGGETYPVPAPFLVMATQNPIEQEGVYPLPEAQRDRFLMKIIVGYPTDVEEREIVYRMGVSAPEPSRVFTPADLITLQQKADRVFVHNALVDYTVRLVLATRAPAAHGMPDVAQLIQYGASPRASLGIVRGTRALALLRGRDYALPQDVQDIAPDILRHRLVLSYDALADDIPADHIVARVLAAVPPPTVAPRQNAAPQPAAAEPAAAQPASAWPGRLT